MSICSAEGDEGQMQIIIPMTGFGSRFSAAGYREIKPFISIGGKPIIQWIVDGMYPGETDFLFIVREDQIKRHDIRERLLAVRPDARVHVIRDWDKKGPVMDVLRAAGEIADDAPAIINYCDFYMHWDWPAFKEALARRGCEGCIPCYTGFHPHLGPEKNLYASCRIDGDENLIEIREKYSFTQDKTLSRHSPGTYYFRTGALLKQYCARLVDSGQDINGEYYASLPYNFMVGDGLRVWVPANVEYFCQWGTPEDMRESLFWIRAVQSALDGKEGAAC